MTTGDAATTYGRFTGRFSETLAQEFVTALAPHLQGRVLDVGCGPGALTARLVERLGAQRVAGADPSEPFVEATRARLPGVDVRCAPAERLPFDDDTFDVAVAQLVVHFMTDPVAGLREMARVTRPGGIIAACVWDNAGARGPLSPLWQAAHELDPAVGDESAAVGAREGQLAEVATLAGLVDVQSSSVTVHVPFSDVEDWWAPLAAGVGSGGAFVTRLDDRHRAALRELIGRRFGPGPFTADATAWCVTARVPYPAGGA